MYNEKKALEKQVTALQTKLNEHTNAGKSAEDLTKELGATRIELDSTKENVNKLLQGELDGLDEAQKKTVTDFASEDPFKRLQFARQLKQQGVLPPKNSQGNPPTDNGPVTIDVDTILKEAAKNNLKPYQDAIKTHGDKAKKLIAAKTSMKASQTMAGSKT